MNFPDLVKNELDFARKKYAPHNSAHESYAVILEELDEFWNEVKMKNPNHSRMLEELIQIGAMAQRAAEDLGLMAPANKQN